MTVLGKIRRPWGPARRLMLALQPVLERLGLTVRVWRAFEGVLSALGRKEQAAVAADGLPLPPVRLRVRVIAQADMDLFISSGANDKREIVDLAAAGGVDLAAGGRILDFGCGSGRVLRHWRDAAGLEVHGSDHDRELVDWLQTALPFVQTNRNELEPPLPYPDGHFDMVYSISVFTHLTEDLAQQWIAELRRIVRPEGLLMFSVIDERNLDRLRPRELEAYRRGEMVVQFADAPGTNLCVAYHPDAYLDSLAQGFERIDAREVGLQRMCVFQRVPSAPAA